MKKLLAMLLAGIMLTATMSMVAWADEDEPVDEVIAGYEFSTFGEFYEFKNTLTDDVVSEAGTVDTETYKRILGTDGLYLPFGYSLEDVESFFTAPSYTSVDFEFEDVTLSLIYGSISSGYSTAKDYAESGKYSGKVLETDGVTVYYYNFSGTYEGTLREDLTYWWVQDGKTYELRLQGYHSDSETGYEELYGDELLAMCNASYHSFGEAYSLTAEAADGKVTLSWDEVVEDETYTVYYKRSSSDEWKIAGTTTKHKVNITGLKNGVSYDFKVEILGNDSEAVTATPTDEADESAKIEYYQSREYAEYEIYDFDVISELKEIYESFETSTESSSRPLEYPYYRITVSIDGEEITYSVGEYVISAPTVKNAVSTDGTDYYGMILEIVAGLTQ